MYNIPKIVFNFVNIVLLSVVYVVSRVFISGFDVFNVGASAFMNYASTFFIEGIIVSIVILMIIN